MRYQLVYSPRSSRDLDKIRRWITDESGSATIASRFLAQLFDACDSLRRLPHRFAVYPYSRSWRMMPFGNYLVFFQVVDNEVRIGHVRHSARRPFFGPQ